MNITYKIKRGVHLALVILFIPISVVEVLSNNTGHFLEEFEDWFFDKVRDWVGYNQEKEA